MAVTEWPGCLVLQKATVTCRSLTSQMLLFKAANISICQKLSGMEFWKGLLYQLSQPPETEQVSCTRSIN